MTKVAIIGSGNIGTDLMFKVMRLSDSLEMGMMVGIDPASDGLARAGRLGIPTTADGVAGLIASPQFDDIEIVFDATSAGAHRRNAESLLPLGKRMIDLTPAAIGPYVVPSVNLAEHIDAPDVNMVTCGGQATIPMVAAVSTVVSVHYAEIVASISSRSAGPGTRANIDEFTETTAQALEVVGGASAGKAIIVLNPAEPPMIMRDTVLMIVDRLDPAKRSAVAAAIEAQVEAVHAYVPGYRLKQTIQFSDEGTELDGLIDSKKRSGSYTRISIFLEVEGAAHYLPSYAGNLDIMTSAALRVAEQMAAHPVAQHAEATA
ncbi:MAG: acetaldehyde dehydrogenase (acetylating) [Mycetocola sp.]